MMNTLLKSLLRCYESYLYQLRLTLTVNAGFRNTDHGSSQMFNILYSRKGAKSAKVSRMFSFIK